MTHALRRFKWGKFGELPLTAPGSTTSGENSWPDPRHREIRADDTDSYEAFCTTVALRQLTRWLPVVAASPLSVLDVSRPLPDAMDTHDHRIRDLVMAAGHDVVSVARGCAETAGGSASPQVVVADPRSLGWIRSESLDAIVAEGGALSDCLATEDTMTDIARVLRPGGRLLASADSLVLGLAQLAEQHRWPELADAPAADVVLVPNGRNPGGYSRCFGPEDLAELLAGAGLEVEWIRPRTVLPAAAVRQTLASDPGALGDLVLSELELERGHEGEQHGGQLVVSGRKPR